MNIGNYGKIHQQSFGLGRPIANGTPNSISTALSTANTWVALGFLQADTKYLSAIAFKAATWVGTAASVAMNIEVQSDANGLPSGTVLETITAAAGSFNTSDDFFKINAAGTTQLTAGTRYWLVFKCTTSPTHYGSITTGSGTSPFDCKNTFEQLTSTDGVPTWGSSATGRSGYMFYYTDGTHLGDPVATSNNTVFNFYSGYESGIEFMTPPNVALNVIAIAARMPLTGGSPTTDAVFKIYANKSKLLATSLGVPPSKIIVTHTYLFLFAQPVIIPASTMIQVVGSSSGGDSTNHFHLMDFGINKENIGNDWDESGRWVLNQSGSWSYPGTVHEKLFPLQILLHPTQPYAPLPLNRRQFNSMR